MFTKSEIKWGRCDQYWQCLILCCRTPSVGCCTRWRAFWRNRKLSAAEMTNPSGGRAARRSTLALRLVANNKRHRCRATTARVHKWKALKALWPFFDGELSFQKLLKDMEALLGGWRSLLLPLASDPEIPRQAQQLCRALSAKGVTVSEDMLMVWCSALLLIRKTHAHKHQLLTVSLWVQVVLAASPGMTQEDLQQLAWGFSPDWDAECDSLLHAAVSKVTDQEEPRDHVVLILDKVRLNPLKGQGQSPYELFSFVRSKMSMFILSSVLSHLQYLQKLPWESMRVMKSLSVSRMPSLHSLVGLCVQKEVRLDLCHSCYPLFEFCVDSFSCVQVNSLSVLQQGVDRKQAFYVLDPDGNLAETRNRFKEWFSR